MKSLGHRLPRRVVLRAPAKVNLHLEVLRERRDGYHEIETILQAIDIQDCLQVTLQRLHPGGEPEIELMVRPSAAAPDDHTNLCWRAARLFCDRMQVSGHLQIELLKDIPTGAGLGGGSSDAMAVLVACNNLFETGLDTTHLERLGAEIGSDVPFFARGGTQLGRGRGTELTPLAPLRKVCFVVLKPSFSIDTGNIYRGLKLGLTAHVPAVSLQVVKPLLARFPCRPWFGFNRLEEVVLPSYPELSRLLLRLREDAAVAMLAGSGSAIYGVFEHAEQAARLVREMAPTMEFVRFVGPQAVGVRVIGGT